MINIEIFKLLGSVFINNDEANKSLHKTDTKGQKLAKSLHKMGNTAKKASKVMSIGLGSALTASVALGKKVGDTADRLLDLEDITGMTTDSIQKWENAAVVAGTSTEAMTNASEKLTKTMDTMSAGTGKAAEAASKLGYSYEDLNAMNADERMNVLTTALQGVTDKTERSRIGTDLFGGSWKDMAPIVALGVDGLKDAKDNAVVFDKDSLNSANDFRVGFDEVKKTIGNLAMKLAIEMMPMLNKFISFITDNMPTIQVIMKTVFDVVSNAINIAIDVINEYFVPAIANIYNWVQANMPVFQEIFRVAFETIWNVINGVWDILEVTLMPILKLLFTWVDEHMPGIQKTFEVVFGGINKAIEFTVDKIEKVVSVVKTAIEYIDKLNKKSIAKKETREKTANSGNAYDIKGMREHGGPVRAGESYIVGEKRAEVFTPTQNGYISPSVHQGINQTININSAKVLSPSEIKRKIQESNRQLAMEWGV